jgi:hypothetical protein
MKLQRWVAYKKVDNEKTDIGTVVTALNADNRTAWAKASQAFVGKPYTMGWSLHVRKSEAFDI